MICRNCDNLIQQDKPGRLDVCSKCNSFLHSCYNCKFYDKRANNECRESQAEWVRDKKMANFCGYFAVNTGNSTDKPVFEKPMSRDEAKKKWNELFKKK